MAHFQIGSKPPASYDDPAGMLVHCHRRIEGNLDSLPRILDALAACDPEAKPALGEVLRYFDRAGVRHTEDEEFSVFPRIAGDATRALIDTLHAEHQEHEVIYLAFRTVALKLLEAPDPERIPELRDHAKALSGAYRDHIAREEKDLIPAIQALPEVELRAIGLEMRLRRGG